jgi:hypothetical protein
MSAKRSALFVVDFFLESFHTQRGADHGKDLKVSFADEDRGEIDKTEGDVEGDDKSGNGGGVLGEENRAKELDEEEGADPESFFDLVAQVEEHEKASRQHPDNQEQFVELSISG